MEDLQDNPLVDSKLGDDVGHEQVAVVLVGGIHARLGQEARPSKGHEPAQLGPLSFVVGVVDVWSSVLHEEGGELEEQDAH